MTDEYPEETSWKLIDVNPDGMVLSTEPGTYTSFYYTLYDVTYCLEIESCHQVTIYDSANDGICCGSGDGGYKIIYEW